jgi:hypothetical protein
LTFGLFVFGLAVLLAALTDLLAVFALLEPAFGAALTFLALGLLFAAATCGLVVLAEAFGLAFAAAATGAAVLMAGDAYESWIKEAKTRLLQYNAKEPPLKQRITAPNQNFRIQMISEVQSIRMIFLVEVENWGALVEARGKGKVSWAKAGLSGAFSDRSTFYRGDPVEVRTSCLPAGRNSALFRRQPLSCPTYLF